MVQRTNTYIYTHTYIQRLAFNTLMWGSLRLAPNHPQFHQALLKQRGSYQEQVFFGSLGRLLGGHDGRKMLLNSFHISTHQPRNWNWISEVILT